VTETTNQWITEQLHPFYRTGLNYTEILHEEQTPYQHIQVIQTEFFGRVLLLDGIIQLTELDNMGYHEMMTHVPLLAHDNPKRVLIVGGGDGGALRQVLYHPVEEAVLCEIDQRVVDVCIEFFPCFNNPFKDSRAKLVVQDAFEYLKSPDAKFDVIMSDTTDPRGAAEKLFTDTFYELMVSALNPNGVVVTQCEQMYFDKKLIQRMMNIAKKLVQKPAYYYTLVPTYPGGEIGFLYMSNSDWRKGIGKPYPKEARYFNPEIHVAAFALPQFLKELLF